MLYLRKYLTNSQKTFFGWKIDEGGYCEWKFQGLSYFGFAVATLQIFQHPENVKISILPFTLAEMLRFRQYLTNSQKTFFGWKMKM